MLDETIIELAKKIKITTNELIIQLGNIGIKKTPTDKISQEEKKILFLYFNQKYNNNIKITLQKKIKSTLNVCNINGKNKLIKIEIRKKKTYIKKQTIQNITINDLNKEQQTILEQKETVINTKEDINKNNNNNTKNKKHKCIKQIEYQETNKHEIKKQNNKLPTRTQKKISILTKNTKNKKPNKQTKNKKNNQTHYSNYYKHKENKQNIQTKKTYINVKNNSKEKIIIPSIKKTIKKHINIHKNQIINPIVQKFNKPTNSTNKKITIGNNITITELASKMAVKSYKIIKIISQLGIYATKNQKIDQETAQLIAEDMGYVVIQNNKNKIEDLLIKNKIKENENKIIKERAPIITIMGHVDHGKTSLIDCIQSTNIQSKEYGGITQKLGSYSTIIKNKKIIFLDTPGHEAFFFIRKKGIQITDIAILIIAADDGIMPQTIEAIHHIKKEKLPIIVVISKIDKNNKNTNQIKNELTKYDIFSKEWGGEVNFIEISTKTKYGINDLLNCILSESKKLKLTANYNKPAYAIVIESYIDKGKGPIAKIFIKDGILHKGDVVLCDTEYGRIRKIINETKNEVLLAEPSSIVEILGLSGILTPGNKIIVTQNEKQTKKISIYRRKKNKEKNFFQHNKMQEINDNLINNNSKNQQQQTINLIIKSNTQNELEAINYVINKIILKSDNNIKIEIISSGIGNITKENINLAETSKAQIIGFNVKIDLMLHKTIKKKKIKINLYSSIYDVVHNIKKCIKKAIHQIHDVGVAKVKNIFLTTNQSEIIAGCAVTSGKIKINDKIHILREKKTIFKGEIESLRHFKQNVNVIIYGQECGIKIKNFNKIKIGDIIKVHKTNKK